MAALRSFVYRNCSRDEVDGLASMSMIDRAPGEPDFTTEPPGAWPETPHYDRFGWGFSSLRCPAMMEFRDAAVQRTSLGRHRYHIELSPGVCARNSYHDGHWIGPHVGERINVELGTPSGPVPVAVNVMDDSQATERRSHGILVSHMWMDNYAHSLLETASRLWFATDNAGDFDSPVYWDITKPWQRELADMLLPGREIIPLPADKVAFDTLYVPGYISQIGSSATSVNWLRKAFKPPEISGKRRIFISRADATERRVINENEVLDMLRPMGFEPVMLTGMTLREQIALFNEAEAVIAPHGAGCANILFAGTGTRFIEFVPQGYPHHMYWRIAKWAGLWHGRILCPDNAQHDMHVDLTVLKAAIEASGL